MYSLLCSVLLGSSFVLSQDALANYVCDLNKCKLPTCRCATKEPPVANPPQFLLLTFDDSIQKSIWPQTRALLNNRKNPNGCAVKATFYTQVEYTDPLLTLNWYSSGNEVGDHSVTHQLPSANSYAEMEGMRAFANQNVGLSRGKIMGVRFPFLNYSLESINMLAKMGFTYDSSLSAYPSEKIWPYTLDNGVVNDCLGQLSICGKPGLNASGLWEIPMYTIEGMLYN